MTDVALPGIAAWEEALNSKLFAWVPSLSRREVGEGSMLSLKRFVPCEKKISHDHLLYYSASVTPTKRTSLARLHPYCCYVPNKH